MTRLSLYAKLQELSFATNKLKKDFVTETLLWKGGVWSWNLEDTLCIWPDRSF